LVRLDSAGGGDGPSADDLVTLVHNGGLAWGYGFLRRFEGDLPGVNGKGAKSSRRRGLLVSVFDLDLHILSELLT
jgi:hypothetical protein